MKLVCHRNIKSRTELSVAIHVCIMGITISNRNTLLIIYIWNVLCLNLYFDGTQAYMVVAHSFATFGGIYAPGVVETTL